jgi:hypothetical protein
MCECLENTFGRVWRARDRDREIEREREREREREQCHRLGFICGVKIAGFGSK